MDYNQPIISKKKIIIVIVSFFVLFGIGCLIYFVAQGPSQDIPDTQEPQFDFVNEGSKVAGIQILLEKGGVVQGQYDKVVEDLDKTLPELEPDALFFNYIDGSLSFASSGNTDSAELEIDESTVTGNAEFEVDIPEEEYVRISDEDLEEEGLERVESIDTVNFAMISSSGAEYSVSVYTAGDLTTAKVTVERK